MCANTIPASNHNNLDKRSSVTEVNYKRNTCASCGQTFQHKRKKKYCSDQCKQQLYRRNAGKLPIDEYNLNRRQAAHWFECEWCGKDSHRRLSGTTSSPNRFCSMQCRVDNAAQLRRALEAEAQKASLVRRLCSIVRRVAKSIARQEQEDKKVFSPCLVCGKPCGYEFGRGRLYCSRECANRSPVMKLARKISKATRSARKHSVAYERFNPEDVLARDGWRCQICGVSTPQSRRGMRYKNSPELDHVVPISKGGEHTRANTQCTCRQCNSDKSNKVVTGQRGLFACA